MDGAFGLYYETDDLKEGAGELHLGTNTFQEKTENMDTEISDAIENTINELAGKDVEIQSFVSENFKDRKEICEASHWNI